MFNQICNDICNCLLYRKMFSYGHTFEARKCFQDHDDDDDDDNKKIIKFKLTLF